MLKNSYLLAKIGANTAENDRNFAKNWQLPYGCGRGPRAAAAAPAEGTKNAGGGRTCETRRPQQRERSVKIKLKIKKTYFENKNNTILKIKDLAAKIKWFSSKIKPFRKMLHFGKIPKKFG